MTNGDAPAQDAYETVLADLRAQKAKIEQTIELIESLRGGVRAPQQQATPSAPAGVGEGDFLGMTIADAAVKLLSQRRKTMGNAEMLAEFKRGGLVLTANDPMNVVNSVLARRFQQVGDIVRVERGVWGLQQWYPGRNFKKKNGVAAADASEPAKPEEPVASVPFMITQAMREKLRQLGASDEDIKQMTPEEAQSYIDSLKDVI